MFRTLETVRNNENIASLDREKIFQLVQNKSWEALVNIFKNNAYYKIISSDPVLQPLLNTHFVDEIYHSSKINKDPAYKYHLQDFVALHNSDRHEFSFSDENLKKVKIRIAEMETKLELAYKYASEYPEDEFCKGIIKKFKETQPKVISHTQHNQLYVTENKNVQAIDHRISLFKSNQEYLFYKAVRDVYPSFLAFPNVAISAVIGFNAIKESLTATETKHFFTGLIDCVVIDAENNFKPIKFFELDSPYHDNGKQQEKDALKDAILAKAGQSLIRIRRLSIKSDEADFVKLIREAIK